MIQVFIPNFLDISNFLTLFTDINSLITFLSMPIVLIGCYLFHLLFLGISSKLCWKISERISPSKSGVIPRNIRSKAANYYHIRSFKVTHPFHPLLGKKYDLVTYRHNWGENRVYFHDKNRGLINYIRISQLMKYS